MVSIEKGKTNRIPFGQRLFWSVLTIFLGFICCFLLFQYQREKEFVQEKLHNILNNYNYQLYQRSQQADNLDIMVRNFIDEIPQHEMRVTIISPAGTVLFDNDADGELGNHNDRPEVTRARNQNEGYAVRVPQSTGKRYFYSARNMGGYIYRSALPYDPYVKTVLAINKDFIYFLALMVMVCCFVLSRFSVSIGRTISRLREFARNVEKGNIPDKDYVFPHDELGDISENIVTLYRSQQKAKQALSMERDKIVKHFQYSQEGFAMFTAEGREILSNILYIQFLNLLSDKQIHQSEDGLDIPEMKPVKLFLNKNIPNIYRKRKVLRETLTIDKKGKIFFIECLLFLDNSYEIVISDISRQEEESRMKRQLTQNVAHELKTPVSSIQGYLETILSNPDLPADKRQFFLERCFSQSSRLTGLLRDISVLNRLEEASEMFELAEVSITKLVNEIRQECSKELEEKRIETEIILPGEPVIYGNYSLLYSIFRNLFDNSIAYAGEGIRITLNCYKEDPKYYYFSFSNNGVGVQEEHINRIFERFYRVDKGRSRKVGGTGLGLSIVKNGVNFHKGQISAKSNPGSGLTFFLYTEKESLTYY